MPHCVQQRQRRSTAKCDIETLDMIELLEGLQMDTLWGYVTSIGVNTTS